MKLSDFIDDIGRPIAYYPALAKKLGGVKEALFLCQLIYWFGKQRDPQGWIYKQSAEIERETGLSAKEQRTARRNLVELGVLEERHARLEHRIYYRVKFDGLRALWDRPGLPGTVLARCKHSASTVRTLAQYYAENDPDLRPRLLPDDSY